MISSYDFKIEKQKGNSLWHYHNIIRFLRTSFLNLHQNCEVQINSELLNWLKINKLQGTEGFKILDFEVDRDEGFSPANMTDLHSKQIIYDM